MVTLRTRDLFNPVNIVGGGFLFNMLLATQPLSPLQRDSWIEETRVVFLQATVLWFLIPALILFFYPVRRCRWLSTQFKCSKIIHNPWIGRSAALAVIAVFPIESWWQSGTLLPFLHPAVDIHTEHTSGLALITTALCSATGVVLLIYYLKSKQLLDLLLLVLMFVLPLTQLARLNIFALAITLTILGYYLVFPRNIRYAFSLGVVFLAIFSFFLLVSRYRELNRGTAGVNYARDIGWDRGDQLSQAAAIYIRYFVFSFDSFDGLVRRNPSGSERTLGAFTFRPISSGVFRLHNVFDDYPMHDYLATRSDPVLGGVVIATGLSYFYLDFGSELIAIPLLFYMSLVLILYYRKSKNVYWAVAYSILASALALASFTDLLSSVNTLYTVVFCLLILWLSLGERRVPSLSTRRSS